MDASKDIVLKIEQQNSNSVGYFSVNKGSELEDIATLITSAFADTFYGEDIETAPIGEELINQEGVTVTRIK